MTDRNVANPARQNAAETRSLTVFNFHAPTAHAVARLSPLARDTSITGFPFLPQHRRRDEALRLDQLLPRDAEFKAMELRLTDALYGKVASMQEIATVAPLLFARGAVKQETLPMRLAVLLEVLALERSVAGFSMDLFVVAMMTNLRQSRFVPEPAEVVEMIHQSRAEMQLVTDALPRLLEGRWDVDDYLVEAGLREFVDNPDIPWYGPGNDKGARK